MKFLTLLLITSLSISYSSCFVPLTLLEGVLLRLEEFFGVRNFGRFSDTMTHEEISRSGIIRAAAQYFHAQSKTDKNGQNLINLSKLDKEYKDLANVYGDFYGNFKC